MIFVFFFTVNGVFTQPVPCCLCNATRHHAPCLVDLETGSVTELSVYDPHPSITGELAEEQHTTGTFSFVTCGEAQGYRNTAQKKVEITVPDSELTGLAALCTECQNHYSIDLENRYILMDLYEKEKAYRIPLIEQSILLRCYKISIIENDDGTTITITGTIDK